MSFKGVNSYLEKLIKALQEENEANREMLDNFFRYLETEDQIYLRLANKQLKEILKGAGLGVLLILPFSPITIPYLFKRAKKNNLRIFPIFQNRYNKAVRMIQSSLKKKLLGKINIIS